MNKKERAIVYPVDSEFLPILRHKDLLVSYEIIGLVSLKGWGFVGLDAGDIDKGNKIGMKITDDFENSLKNCDTVIISQSVLEFDIQNVIYPNICKAIDNGKNILCTFKLGKKLEDELIKKCKKSNVYFRCCYTDDKSNIEDYKNAVNSEIICDISTPVIFVLGVSERTNKFEIQVSLRENLLKMGYKVSQVGSRGYCELLGFHSFPEFMYNNALSEVDKIIQFNHFIKYIELAEKPDIILIGIPGGTVPFNNQFNNNFGIFAYEVSQALLPDVTVVSILNKGSNEEYFRMLPNCFKYKFGYDIDYYNLANYEVDWLSSESLNEIQYINLKSDVIDEKKQLYEHMNEHVYNILNKEDSLNMTNHLIDKLAEYGSYGVI
ncbi:TIGR04066 family peptide maturation system protein [Clostridium botulinum]|nr:TIGR04066 family peptide maturation system protein [Clostridium botulinum]